MKPGETRYEWTVHGRSVIQTPVPSMPGYVRYVTVDCDPDDLTLVTLRDTFGTVLLTGDGVDILRRAPLYGEQLEEPREGVLPLEFGPKLGCISAANAALLLSINLVFKDSAKDADILFGAEFWPLSEEMVGLGSICQWIKRTATAGGSHWWRLPHLGGYIPHFFLMPSEDVEIEAMRFDGLPVEWEVTKPEDGTLKVSCGGRSNPLRTNPASLIEIKVSGTIEYLHLLPAQWIPAGVLVHGLPT